MASEPPAPDWRRFIASDIALLLLGGAGIVLFTVLWSGAPHADPSTAVVNDIAGILSIARAIAVGFIALAGSIAALAAYRRGGLLWRPFLPLACTIAVLTVVHHVGRAWSDQLDASVLTRALGLGLTDAAKAFFAVMLSTSTGCALWRRLGGRRGLLWTPQTSGWISLALASVRAYLMAGVSAGILIGIAVLSPLLGLDAVALLPDAEMVEQLGGAPELLVITGSVVSATLLGFAVLHLVQGLVATWTGHLWIAAALAGLMLAAVAPTMPTSAVWLMSPSSAAAATTGVIGLVLAICAFRYGVVPAVMALYLLFITICATPLFAGAGPGLTSVLVLLLAAPALAGLPGLVISIRAAMARKGQPVPPPLLIDVVGPEATSRIASLREPRPGHPGPSSYLGDKSVLVLGARRNDEFIGYIAVRKAETGPSEVLDIFVRPADRALHLGTRMMHEARAILAVEGRRALRAVVEEDDAASRAFFDSAGLLPVQVIVRAGTPAI